MGDAAADAAFVSTERMLSERQIDFDIVNEDALAKDLMAGQGTLETASGNQLRDSHSAGYVAALAGGA